MYIIWANKKLRTLPTYGGNVVDLHAAHIILLFCSIVWSVAILSSVIDCYSLIQLFVVSLFFCRDLLISICCNIVSVDPVVLVILFGCINLCIYVLLISLVINSSASWLKLPCDSNATLIPVMPRLHGTWLQVLIVAFSKEREDKALRWSKIRYDSLLAIS